jgi:hypothetical protein
MQVIPAEIDAKDLAVAFAAVCDAREKQVSSRAVLSLGEGSPIHDAEDELYALVIKRLRLAASVIEYRADDVPEPL